MDLDDAGNLRRLRELMVKTVDRIVDPNSDEPIIRELFQIKHLFCKIPDDKASLEFIQKGLLELKNHDRYAIKSKKALNKSNPEDAVKLQIAASLGEEAAALPNKGRHVDIHRLRNWKSIAINKDTQGKLLMAGNQTMTAIALGMVGQDQYPEFNEVMKAVMLQPLAQQLNLAVKVGHKEGVVRIW